MTRSHPLAAKASSTRYVLGQTEWLGKSRWLPYELADDLTYARNGIKLASWARDVSALSHIEREELFSLLRSGQKVLNVAQRERLRQLHKLAPCTTDRIPILDLDVDDERPGFTPEQGREESVRLARLLAKQLETDGVGPTAWSISNVNGGLHGRVLGPPIQSSIFLPYAFLALVRDAAHKAGVPLASEQSSKKKKALAIGELYVEPLVCLDDGILKRDGLGRTNVWRVATLPKPKPGSVYVPCRLDAAIDHTSPKQWLPGSSEAWLPSTIGNTEIWLKSVEMQIEIDRQEQDAEKVRNEAAEARKIAQKDRPKASQNRGGALGSEWPRAYVSAVVSGYIDKMRSSGKGDRNPTLNEAAYVFGRLEAGGAFAKFNRSVSEIKNSLIEAAIEAGGHSREHIYEVANRAWGDGALNAATPPPPLRKNTSTTCDSESHDSATSTSDTTATPDRRRSPNYTPDPVLLSELTWLERTRPIADRLRANEVEGSAISERPSGKANAGETDLAFSGWVCEAALHPHVASAALHILGVSNPAFRVQKTYEKIAKEPGFRPRGARALEKLLSLAGLGHEDAQQLKGALETLRSVQKHLEFRPVEEPEARRQAWAKHRNDRARILDQYYEIEDPFLAGAMDEIQEKGMTRLLRLGLCREFYAKQVCPARDTCAHEVQGGERRYQTHIPCNDRACEECRGYDRGAKARFAIKWVLEKKADPVLAEEAHRLVQPVVVKLKQGREDPDCHQMVFERALAWLGPNAGRVEAMVVPGLLVILTRQSFPDSSMRGGLQRALRDGLEKEKNLLGIGSVELLEAMPAEVAIKNAFKRTDVMLDIYYRNITKGSATKVVEALGEDPWKRHHFHYHTGKNELPILKLPSKKELKAQKQRDQDASVGLVDGPEQNCGCGKPLRWDLLNSRDEILERDLEHVPQIGSAIRSSCRVCAEERNEPLHC
jgi:hypothetical protein